MSFPISSGLLDAMVLSVVNREDTYGYEITQYLRRGVDISESTLYPVLRRLQKSGFLETYDREYMGRNRRYYHITALGITSLRDYRDEWENYKQRVDKIIGVNES